MPHHHCDYIRCHIIKYNEDMNDKMKPLKKKGVKFARILDVDPCLFIMPPLHIKLGLVNQAFIKGDGQSYLSWSSKRIKNIPHAEKMAWNIFCSSEDKINDLKEDIDIFIYKIMIICILEVRIKGT